TSPTCAAKRGATIALFRMWRVQSRGSWRGPMSPRSSPCSARAPAKARARSMRSLKISAAAAGSGSTSVLGPFDRLREVAGKLRERGDTGAEERAVGSTRGSRAPFDKLRERQAQGAGVHRTGACAVSRETSRAADHRVAICPLAVRLRREATLGHDVVDELPLVARHCGQRSL